MTATILIWGPSNLHRFLDIVDSYVMIYFMTFIPSVFGDFGQFKYLKLNLLIEQMIGDILK